MFKKFLKFDEESNLIKDSLILFSSTMVLNVAGYFFHFYMGRTLGPKDYGILGAILSLSYIFIVLLNVIQTSITKFVSDFKAKNKKEEISFLFSNSLKRLTIYGIILVIIFIALTPVIGKFLHISIIPLLVLSPMLILVLILPISRGILQGMQDFKNLGFNLILEGIIKLFGGILLIIMGLKVNGATSAIILSMLFAFLLAYSPLKKFITKEKKSFDTKLVYKYSIPVLIVLLSLTAFYSVDVILVKHFFSDIDAGYYAALSLIGKIIFFGSISISSVMFPKVAELYAAKKPHRQIFNRSLLFVFLISIFINLVYFIAPKLVVKTLFGNQYLSIAPLIGLFGIVMTLFSLVYTLAMYNLSINRTRFIYLLILFNIIEIVLILLFHKSLMQVVEVLIGLMGSLFMILLIISRIRKNG